MDREEDLEVIRALDALDADDPETAHANADEIVLDLLPFQVRDAYQRVVDRCSWWATA